MPKTTVFVLNRTIKCGRELYLKGTTFNEDTLPADLKVDINAGSDMIEIKSYGEDFEGSTFDPEETITFKEPKKRLISKKKKT